jgi:serine/threonine protein phosphatase PrpC
MIRLDLATDAFIGARSQQQDAAGAYGFGTAGGALLVLGDGLGGHTGGAEASHIVRETFREAAGAGAFDDPATRRSALLATLERANQRIANGLDPSHGQRGMASTAVAVVVADGHASWISVGDSHLYVWRAGRLRKLNEDHSQAGLMLRSGQYGPDDPEIIAAKSILVSALTGRRLELVDHPENAFKLEAGDIVLLASDGLNTISEEQIQDLLTRMADRPATDISTGLLTAVRARRAERQDNTAVVVARVLDLGDATRSAKTEVVIPSEVTSPTEARTGLATVRVEPEPERDKTITGHPDAPAAKAGADGATAGASGPERPTPSAQGAARSLPGDSIRTATRPTRPFHSPASPAQPNAQGFDVRPARRGFARIAAVLIALAIAGAAAFLAASWLSQPPHDQARSATPAPAPPPVQLPPLPSSGSQPAQPPGQPARATAPGVAPPQGNNAQPLEPTRTPGAGQTEAQPSGQTPGLPPAGQR